MKASGFQSFLALIAEELVQVRSDNASLAAYVESSYKAQLLHMQKQHEHIRVN
jgi:hypothetical protein